MSLGERVDQYHTTVSSTQSPANAAKAQLTLAPQNEQLDEL
jgi:hypothetical protein